MASSPIATAGVVIVKEGKVLLVRHGVTSGHVEGMYGIPAGRVDQGETAREAAIRELCEEAGLTVRGDDLVELPYLWKADIAHGDQQKSFSLRAYACTSYSGELKSSAETTPEWVSLDDLEQHNLLPNVRAVIADALKFLGKTV
jgi:mutator protein MutT